MEAGGPAPPSVGFGQRVSGAFLGAANRLESAETEQLRREILRLRFADFLEPTRLEDVRDAAGNLIGQRNQKTNEFTPIRQATRPRQRQVRIDELVSRGLSRNQAADIVDQNLELVTDPLTGLPRGTFNVVTGELGPVAPATPNDQARAIMAARPAPPPQPSAGGQAATAAQTRTPAVVGDRRLEPTAEEVAQITGGINVPEQATGPLDTAAAVAAGTPIVGHILREFGVDGRDERQARVAFRALGQDMIRAFANNQRFPIAEQQRLTGLLPSSGFFSTTGGTLADLSALDRELTTRLQEEARIVNDPTVSADVRGEAQATAEALPGIIRRLRAFIQSAGGRVGDISEATVDDLAVLVRNGNLSEADRKRVRQRLLELQSGNSN